MKKVALKIPLIICFLFLLLPVYHRTMTAQEKAKTPVSMQMKSIELKKLNDNRSDVIIRTSGLVKYSCFKVTDPPRLVVEMTDTINSWSEKEISVNNTLVRKIRSSQFQDEPVKIVRIVLDLTRDINYEAVSTPDNITITVFNEAAVPPVNKQENPGKKNMDSKASGMGENIPEVKKSEAVVVKSTENNSAEEQENIQKTSTLETEPVVPEKNIEDMEHRALVAKIKKQEQKTAVEELDKKGTASIMEGVVPPISDELVSLNFYQADITEVFRVLAEQSGINFVYGTDVKGTLTLFLDKVTFDNAFRSVLKLNGLVAQKEAENIIRIVSPDKLKEERGKAVRITRKFALKYTTAEDIKEQFQGMEFGGVNAIVKTDKTTNSLVITSTPEGLEEYAKIIGELDVMPRQVMIEARLMEMSIDNVPIDIGVDWSVARDFNNRSERGSQTDDLITIGRTFDPNVYGNSEGFDTNQPAVLSPANGGSGVNLTPYIPTTGGLLRIGSVLNKTRFNLTLAALSQSKNVKELSHPKVITLNNEEAKILVGDKIPVKEKSVDQGVMTESTKYLDTGIKLSVTPTINEDGYITLVVHPEVSSYSPSGDSFVISSREAQTKVLIKNGDTIVIGGLISEKEVVNYNKVPVLGDIPVIGFLFKHKKITKQRTELIVFVTANIVEQQQ